VASHWADPEYLRQLDDERRAANGRKEQPRRGRSKPGRADSVSVPPYRSGTGTEYVPGPFPEPVPCSRLRSVGEDARWLVDGYLARGEVTLYSALWKAGKTTWLSHLLRAFQDGGTFCGRAVQPAKVLYVTEEAEHLWADRRDRLGIGDHVSFLVRPFRHKPDVAGWVKFLAYLRELVELNPVDLLVLDTLSKLWPVRDENDACQVDAALMPLHSLTDMNLALLPVHHLSKGDGLQATGTRGSGALTAFPDTIVEMRRYDPGEREDRRRVLTGYGRWDATPAELVVELLEDRSGYVAHGSRYEATASKIREALLRILPVEPPGLTDQDVRANWDGPAPRNQALLDELRRGVNAGDWRREGEGKKGSPFTYWVSVGA
jgi:AAA domain